MLVDLFLGGKKAAELSKQLRWCFPILVENICVLSSDPDIEGIAAGAGLQTHLTDCMVSLSRSGRQGILVTDDGE